jgi:hypothetical protein
VADDSLSLVIGHGRAHPDSRLPSQTIAQLLEYDAARRSFASRFIDSIFERGEVCDGDRAAATSCATLQGTGEVLGQFRTELKEFKPTLEEKGALVRCKLAALEERLKSVPGKLPVAKSSWQPESVTYQAEMVCHNGALYQARKDTAQAPGGSDWICVARHGRDAITPTARGAFDVNECYAQLDIVSFDGAAYIARSDTPGLCSGDGWEPASKRGKQGRRGESVTGPQGEKGAKADKGDDALEIVNWHIDPVNYRAIPFIEQREARKAAGAARTFRAISRRSRRDIRRRGDETTIANAAFSPRPRPRPSAA